MNRRRHTPEQKVMTIRESERHDMGAHARPASAWARIGRPLLLLGTLAATAYLVSQLDLVDGQAAIRVAAHRYGFQGYVLAAVLLACLFVPTPLLAATSGIVFGVGLGAPTALGVFVIAACVQVIVGRAGLGPRLLTDTSRGDGRLHRLLRYRGWRTIATLRLVPFVPFALSNYIAGGTPVSLVSVATGTAIGAAPKTLLYASLGNSVFSLSGQRLAVALALLAGVSIIGFHLARDLWRHSQ